MKYQTLFSKLPASIQIKLLSNTNTRILKTKAELIATIYRIQTVDPKFNKASRDTEKEEKEEGETLVSSKYKGRDSLSNPRSG